MARFVNMRYKKPQNYPVENQCVHRLGNKNLRAAVATMQGFREDMEDAHTAILGLKKHNDCSVFAVFDGHNGPRTATWCSERFPQAIDELEELTPEAISVCTLRFFANLQKKLVELDKEYLETTGDKANGATCLFVILRKLSEEEAKKVVREHQENNKSKCEPEASNSDTLVSTTVVTVESTITNTSNGTKVMETSETTVVTSETPLQSSSAPAPASHTPQLKQKPFSLFQSLALSGASGLTSSKSLDTPKVAAVQKQQPKMPDEPLYHITVGNLGDSRCYIGHYSSPEFVVLTKDHKPSLPEEEARIKAAGGFVARGRVDACLAVSRAFGDGSYKTNADLPHEKQKIIPVPEFQEAYLGAKDFLFLCCDGIFESQPNEAVIQYLHELLHGQDAEPGKVLSNLLYRMLMKGSRDNMTAILIEPKDGDNFTKDDEFIVGEWYKHGNDTYVEAFQLNCTRHGKSVEEVRQLWFEKKKEQQASKSQKNKTEDDDDDEDDDDSSSSSSSDEDTPNNQTGNEVCDSPSSEDLEKDSIITLSGRGKRGLLGSGLTGSIPSPVTNGKLGGVLAKFASQRKSPSSSDNSLLTNLAHGLPAANPTEQDGVKQVQSELILQSKSLTQSGEKSKSHENNNDEPKSDV